MANDERRWKLLVANRVKEIQDLSQLLETLSYERQSTRLGQQGLTVAHASCEHRGVARAGHQWHSGPSRDRKPQMNITVVYNHVVEAEHGGHHRLNTFYFCFIHYAQAPPELRKTALELTDVEVKAAEKKWIKHVARETKEFS
ncbi:hypothetical protein T12_4749 [Trichinella patagoniensis]|uniref:Uncharacterized protein n=1 Tax=Trichinella patagoniensis TaxID=990121 RepID=A0A0V0Z879_9BILA|nr:hypothetical protein T12_4749 [Trichinella patagoniensis]